MRTTLLTLALAVLASAQETYTAEHLARARALHADAIVLDTHSDTTSRMMNPDWDLGERHPNGHMDIQRLIEGGYDCEFFSIYMGRTPGDGTAIKRSLQRIDTVIQATLKHPELEQAFTVADIRRIRKAGRIACLMGIEGGHMIEESLPALRMFHRLGCRYMTLTHSFNLSWADSSGTNRDVKGENDGLSEFGREVVREMNRLGMMVDISHVSDATFWAAAKISKAPLIASHSSVDGVFDHRRNLDDDMLRAVAKSGGVVMINFYNGYIDPNWDSVVKKWELEHRKALTKIEKEAGANLRQRWRARRAYQAEHPMPNTPLVVLARHVEHAAKVMGWEHVGIGADWDGVSALPEGIRHCGDTPRLTALLLARGATEEQLRGFLGENLLRAMERCEQVAREM